MQLFTSLIFAKLNIGSAVTPYKERLLVILQKINFPQGGNSAALR
jgi:hypothetical protein